VLDSDCHPACYEIAPVPGFALNTAEEPHITSP